MDIEWIQGLYRGLIDMGSSLRTLFGTILKCKKDPYVHC